MMVAFDVVKNWLESHGYRDLYPRRDAVDPSFLFYTFVREGRRRIGFPVIGGKVDPKDFDGIKREVASDEQGNGRGDA